MKLSFINEILLDRILRKVRVTDRLGVLFSPELQYLCKMERDGQHHGWYLYPKIPLAATDEPVKSSGRYFSSQSSTQRPHSIHPRYGTATSSKREFQFSSEMLSDHLNKTSKM